ncbi:MAG TPA: hypothetical protein VGP93_11465, partial [Polyangiaceae bacterium]|nr:hypothetical protein [Polyangiaceae bacterium]
HDFGKGIAHLKRAAGMALNAALIVVPNDAWGRSYAEHLNGLARDRTVPEAVRAAAAELVALRAAHGDVVSLTTPSRHSGWLEAARTVMAHAYAVVYGSVGRKSSP